MNLFSVVNTIVNIFRSPATIKRIQGSTRDTVTREWRIIEGALANGSPSQLKQAVITADKVLDLVLKDMVHGVTLGERLKNAKDLFSWEIYNHIWEAHKIRNSLVHDTDFDPTYGVLKDALRKFKEGMIHLHLLS